jgi:hypothetical protein
MTTLLAVKQVFICIDLIYVALLISTESCGCITDKAVGICAVNRGVHHATDGSPAT